MIEDLTFPVDVFISDNLKKPIQVIPHWHDSIEILFMLEGTATQVINNRFFGIQKEDLIIINSGDIHATVCELQDKTRILVIKFLPEVIISNYAKVFEAKYILRFLNLRQNQNYLVADTSRDNQEILHLMMGIYQEFIHKKTGYEIFIKGYIFQLIAYLLRNDRFGTYQPFHQENEFRRLDPLLKYIESNYAEEIDLTLAAKMVNLSYYYFSRLFKKITGRNFKEYMDFVRICEAEKLILAGDKSISQIALEVGFINVSSFNRVFKRIRSYTPSAIKRAKTAKK